MGNYTKVDLETINTILGHYHFAPAKSFEGTATGISNSNYFVLLEDSTEILLKISNDKTIEQLTNEQHILQVLNESGFEYSLAPFKTLTGQNIYHEGQYHGVIFPFVKGAPPKIFEKTLSQIGMALGRLHQLGIPDTELSKLRVHDIVGYGGQDIVNYIESENACSDFKNLFLKIFPGKLQTIPYDRFAQGIIHGDLYYDNSLFHEGELVTLIDFEQAGRGRFILDLGIAISGSCLDDAGLNVDENFMSAFLDGYETQRKILPIEREYLNLAVVVGFFSIALWRIKRFYEGNLDESKRYNYRDLLKRAEAFYNSCGL